MREPKPRTYRADVLTRLERPGDRRRPTMLDAWRMADEMERRRREEPPERRQRDDLPF